MDVKNIMSSCGGMMRSTYQSGVTHSKSFYNTSHIANKYCAVVAAEVALRMLIDTVPMVPQALRNTVHYLHNKAEEYTGSEYKVIKLASKASAYCLSSITARIEPSTKVNYRGLFVENSPRVFSAIIFGAASQHRLFGVVLPIATICSRLLIRTDFYDKCKFDEDQEHICDTSVVMILTTALADKAILLIKGVTLMSTNSTIYASGVLSAYGLAQFVGCKLPFSLSGRGVEVVANLKLT